MANIVVVEDEEDIRDSIQDILELAGHNVTTANNGRRGYEAIIASSPDLVLCDVNMPEMDGYELLGALNQTMDLDVTFPAFLFLTARAELNDIEQGLSLGADDYVVKPFERLELLERINARIRKRMKLIESGKDLAQRPEPSLSFEKLALPCQDGLEIVEFKDIVMCSAERAYCSFKMSDGRNIVVSKPMKDYEGVLESREFIKVHKSSIVNIQYIKKYVRGKSGYLVLSDSTHVPVSVRKRDEVLDLLKSNL